MKYEKEINRRKTFAIISHPDAGKTTLTEKLLLFGGAIQTAGAVKSNKIKKHATSDFMEIERQRGISVATSVMSFEYNNILINLLDTPGHKDFAEDTYRTLTAVDSVILVIDSVNGVEAQTRRLMEVCSITFTAGAPGTYYYICTVPGHALQGMIGNFSNHSLCSVSRNCTNIVISSLFTCNKFRSTRLTRF